MTLKERDASLKNEEKNKTNGNSNTLETPCDTFSPSSPPSSPQVLELETDEPRGNYQYTSGEDDKNEDEVCGSNLNTESPASPSINHQQKQLQSLCSPSYQCSPLVSHDIQKMQCQMTQQPYCDSHFGDRDCQYASRASPDPENQQQCQTYRMVDKQEDSDSTKQVFREHPPSHFPPDGNVVDQGNYRKEKENKFHDDKEGDSVVEQAERYSGGEEEEEMKVGGGGEARTVSTTTSILQINNRCTIEIQY